MSRPGREDLVMVGILVLAFVLFFWDAILLRGAFFVQDVMVQNYPFRDFYSQALKQWQLPLWHSGINCGFPLFAEGQAGVLYPFNLLTAFLLPTFAGITANVVFHMWLGAAGTYWYLRILSCAPAAALAGGLTYGFSGFLVVRAMSQNYIDVNGWMPFLFVLLELAFRTRQLSYLWGVSAVVGLQFLAGHPQATAYCRGCRSTVRRFQSARTRRAKTGYRRRRHHALARRRPGGCAAFADARARAAVWTERRSRLRGGRQDVVAAGEARDVPPAKRLR